MRAKDELKEIGVRPSKARGQNFLVDDLVLHQILQFGRPTAASHIVEIGPGLGALTRHLAQFPKLTLIEIEPKFCEQLKEKYPNAEIINEDVRAVDFSEIGKELLVFGNVPYSFSTDIIFHLIQNAKYVARAILLLQAEFVARLAADPDTSEYGALTVGCQLWADVFTGPIITGDMFHPRTKVDSQLVELRFLKEPRAKVDDLFHFRRVVSAAFSKRRKKLANGLRESGVFNAPQVEAALAKSGIDGSRRAEMLSIEEFAALANGFMPLA